MSSVHPRALGRSAAVMAAGTATSRVLGMLRATMLAAAIGLNVGAANAFAVANWLPNMLYMLIAGGVVNAVLVPQVVRAYRSANGQDYVDRLLSLAGVLLLAVTTVLTVASPLIVRIALDQTDPRLTTLATTFALWCIPQVFFYGAYTLLGQVLNARGNFGPYMWAPVVNNVVAIAGLVVFIAMFGRYVPGGAVEDFATWDGTRITVLAGTATLGVVAQSVVLLVPLHRSGFRFRPRRDWRGAGLGTAGRVAGWTFAALLVGQVGVLTVVRIASAAAQRSQDYAADVAGNNAYNYAFTIFMLPHSLITVSLLTALFTRLSDHAAARDTRAVRADFSYGLRTVAVFTTFAAAALSVLALPLVRVVLPTTRPAEAASLAPVIVGLLTGLVALGAWSLCQRVFYAYEDARGLFRIQAAMAAVVVVGTLLGYLLLPIQWWVATGGASIAASYVLGAIWGGAEVWARLGGGPGRIIRLHVRTALAAAAAVVVGWPLSHAFGDLPALGFAAALAACILVGGVMLVVYLGLLRLLHVGELDDLVAPVVARLRRTMNTSGRAEAQRRPDEHGGDLLDGVVVGQGTLLAGRYRLHQPVDTDLPGVECWTAWDQILDRPVRAMVLRGDTIAQAQDAARRAALVSDPRLLRVLDAGDHEGLAYVVTEPVVGQDLAELTANGPLPPDQARAVIGEAAMALEVARRRGVHHLALRPSALHVAPDGSVMVSGLAMDGELFGLGLGDARSTSRADTVGLVALLYLALTGRWPESASVVPARAPVAPVVGGFPAAPAEIAPGVPNDLDTLCVVTLGPHDDGPHSPAELVRELEPWGPIAAEELYEALEASARSAAAPSGPWSATGAAAEAAARDSARHAAAPVSEQQPPEQDVGEPAPEDGAPEDGAPEDGDAAGDGVTDDAAPVAQVPAVYPPHQQPQPPTVQRLSVRHTFAQPGVPARPGTPPPAIPPPARRSDTPAAAGTRAGATAVVPSLPQPQAPPEAVHQPAPRAVTRAAHAAPDVPVPPVLLTPRPPEEFDTLIGRSEESLTRRRFNPTPLVLTVVAALVVVGLLLAWKALNAPAAPIGGAAGLSDAGDTQTTPGSDQDQTDAPPAGEGDTGGGGAATVPVVASAQMIDPPPGGDNNEHPEAVDRAIDGDSTTFWFSRTYASPTYGMKPGVGYAVTLADPATVTTVTLQVNGTGGMVEVRATDPATPTEGDVLASGPLSPTTVLTLSTPTEAQHVVLWFTALPQTADGKNRIELAEVTLE